MDYEIEVEIEGKIYVGSYVDDGDLLTVYYEGESKSTGMNGASNRFEPIAKQMLRTLILEVNRKAAI